MTRFPLALVAIPMAVALAGCCFEIGGPWCDDQDPDCPECENDCPEEEPPFDPNGLLFLDCVDIVDAGFGMHGAVEYQLGMLLDTSGCWGQEMEVEVWGVDQNLISEYGTEVDWETQNLDGGNVTLAVGLNFWADFIVPPAYGFDAAAVMPHDDEAVYGIFDITLYCADANSYTCPTAVCQKEAYDDDECVQFCMFDDVDGSTWCEDHYTP